MGYSPANSHSPVPPAGAPLGIYQAPASNPIPVDIQSLVNLKPKERVRAVMKMSVASPQDEDSLATVAQNKQWDGKLRLAAAIKLKDSQKRDSLLAELAQDSSLGGDIRLRAAEKILSFEEKKNTLAALTADQSLKEEHRIDAQISIEFILDAQATTTMNKADLAEIKLALEQTKGDILSSLEQVQKLNLDVAPGAGPTQKKAELPFDQDQKLNLEMTLQTADSTTIDKLLAFFAYDPTWTNDNRLEAALKIQRDDSDLASGTVGKVDALILLSVDPTVGSSHRLEAVVKLKQIYDGWSHYNEGDKYLGLLAQDKTLDKGDPSKSYRLEAALKMYSSDRKDYFLALLAKDPSLIHYYRLQAVSHMSSGKKRDQLLVTFAQDPSFSKSHRLQAALSIDEADSREDLLAALAQDSTFSIYHRLSAAYNMKAGLRKDNILAALTQDPTINGYQRIDAVSYMRPGDRRDDLMAAAVQDPSVCAAYRTNCGIAHMSEGKKKDDLLAAIAQDASLSIFDCLDAFSYMSEGKLKNKLAAELGSKLNSIA